MGKYNYEYIIPYNIDYFRENIKDKQFYLDKIKEFCGLDEYTFISKKDLDFLYEEITLRTVPRFICDGIIKSIFSIDTLGTTAVYKTSKFPPYIAEYTLYTPAPQSLIKINGTIIYTPLDKNSIKTVVTLEITTNVPGSSLVEKKIEQEFAKRYSLMDKIHESLKEIEN